MAVKVVGDDVLHTQFKAAMDRVDGVLRGAVNAGADVVMRAADAKVGRAGSYIVVSLKRGRTRTRKADAILPNPKRWYLRLRETGVHPFEINMLTQRSKRSDGDGREINMKGDHSAADAAGVPPAMKIKGPSSKWFVTVVRRGGVKRSPVLKPAMRNNKDAVVADVGERFKAELDAITKGGGR